MESSVSSIMKKRYKDKIVVYEITVEPKRISNSMTKDWILAFQIAQILGAEPNSLVMTDLEKESCKNIYQNEVKNKLSISYDRWEHEIRFFRMCLYEAREESMKIFWSISNIHKFKFKIKTIDSYRLDKTCDITL